MSDRKTQKPKTPAKTPTTSARGSPVKDTKAKDNAYEINAAYCDYLQCALMHGKREQQRKLQKAKIIKQLKFLQKKIDKAREEVLKIKKCNQEVMPLLMKVHDLNKKIESYSAVMDNVNIDDLNNAVKVLEDEMKGLPLLNFHLPQTKKEAKYVQDELCKMAKHMEDASKKEALDKCLQCVEETDRMKESLENKKQSCKEKLETLRDISRDVMSLEISLKPTHAEHLNVEEMFLN